MRIVSAVGSIELTKLWLKYRNDRGWYLPTTVQATLEHDATYLKNGYFDRCLYFDHETLIGGSFMVSGSGYKSLHGAIYLEPHSTHSHQQAIAHHAVETMKLTNHTVAEFWMHNRTVQDGQALIDNGWSIEQSNILRGIKLSPDWASQREAYQIGNPSLTVVRTDIVETTGEDFLKNYYDVLKETVPDIPLPVQEEMPDYAIFKEGMLKLAGRSSVWLAFDGASPIAATEIYRSSADRRFSFTAITATKREYRGQGIARALKYQSIHELSQEGVTSLCTDNETKHALQKLNERLGFEALENIDCYVKRL